MARMAQSQGGYEFLSTSPQAPFSGGVIAVNGYEIVRATLHRPLPWRQGFALAERHLQAIGRPKVALCALELRCAAPYTPEAFGAFNVQYRALLEEWGLLVDGFSPAARSNVAPAFAPPTEQSLYAFLYTVPTSVSTSMPTFFLSGAAERPSVRPGESSLDALNAKTDDVLTNIEGRMPGLGVTWADVTATTVYTAGPLQLLLERALLPRLHEAAAHGLQWHYSRPPVQGLEIEIDARGLRQELRLFP